MTKIRQLTPILYKNIMLNELSYIFAILQENFHRTVFYECIQSTRALYIFYHCVQFRHGTLLAILLMHLPTPNIFLTGTIQRYFQFRFHSFENRKWIATAQPILLYMCVCIFRFYTRMKCLPVFMWLNVDAWIGTQLHVNIWACVCKGKWKRQREIDGSSAYITIIHILSRHLDRENSLSTKWCTMCAHIHTHTQSEKCECEKEHFSMLGQVFGVCTHFAFPIIVPRINYVECSIYRMYVEKGGNQFKCSVHFSAFK